MTDGKGLEKVSRFLYLFNNMNSPIDFQHLVIEFQKTNWY